MEVAGRVVEGVLKERGEARRDYDQAIQAGPPRRHHRGGAAWRLHHARWQSACRASGRRCELTLTGPAALQRRRGDLSLPAGRGAALHPRHAAARAVGWRRRRPSTPMPCPTPRASRRRCCCRAFPTRCGSALSVELHAPACPSPTCPFQPARRGRRDARRGYRRLGCNPANGSTAISSCVFESARPRTSLSPSLALQPDADGKRRDIPPDRWCLRRTGPDATAGRATSSSCWTAPAAWEAGRWSRPAGPWPAWSIRLTDHDRFTVSPSMTRIETPPGFTADGLVPATDRQRFQAVEFLAGDRGPRRHRDGPAARPRRHADWAIGRPGTRPRILVLVTDGQVGNEDQILRRSASVSRGCASSRSASTRR